MKSIDATCTLTWWAMGLCLVVSLAAAALRPASRTFYGSDTGLCNSGCSELR